MGAFDVVVIGAGPGGYVAAIRAAQLGLKTAVIEREHLGGICLNWGCIPSKSLLRSAEVLRLAKHASSFGLEAGPPPRLSLDLAVKRSRKVSEQLNLGVGHLLSKNAVSIIWGEANITSSGSAGVEIEVRPVKSPSTMSQHPAPAETLGPGCYTARHVIVATGARPKAISTLVPDEKFIWTYFRALTPDILPKTLVVVGAGAIGVEFASFYRELGCDVKLVEMASRILPSEDEEIATLARRQFQKHGMKILTDAVVEHSSIEDDGVSLQIRTSDGKSTIHRAERVISAVGVVPNTTNLGLEALGVAMSSGWIKIDTAFRTNVVGIYAIGDVAGPPMLAHKAEHDGIVCVEAIAGHAHQTGEAHMPACTFCNPNIASIGMTEAAARNAGIDVAIGRFPLRANGKALSYGDPDGMIKTVFEMGSGKLIGAHMIGAEVSELIGAMSVALKAGMTREQLTEVVFPHPTISEAVYESILAAQSKAIHI